MNSEVVYQQIIEKAILAGMRGNFPPETALQVAETLFEEGITIYEFTLNSIGALEAMQAVKQRLGDRAVVGMGTVLSVEDARRVLDAGADFVVSPAFQPEIVQTVIDAGVLMAPGVTTPTEAVAAWQMGMPILKLFPIGPLGVDYFKAIFGPLDHMKFMCNGGMNETNTRELLQAGAVAVGMAGWLTGSGTWTQDRIRDRARILTEVVRSVRSGQPPVVRI